MRFVVFVEHLAAHAFQRRQPRIHRGRARSRTVPRRLAWSGAENTRRQRADRAFGKYLRQIEVVSRIKLPAVTGIDQTAAYRIDTRHKLVVQLERKLYLHVVRAAGARHQRPGSHLSGDEDGVGQPRQVRRAPYGPAEFRNVHRTCRCVHVDHAARPGRLREQARDVEDVIGHRPPSGQARERFNSAQAGSSSNSTGSASLWSSAATPRRMLVRWDSNRLSRSRSMLSA